MNGRDEELLSAYYDGELPAEEKSRAEQLLSEDLSARELLDDVADVTAWIRALPRPSAPTGTQQAVLARIRMATAPQPAVQRAAPPRSNWRRRATWAMVSAAGLIVAVLLQRSWPVPETSVSGDAAVAGAKLESQEFALVDAYADTGAAVTLPLEQSEPFSVDTMHVAMSNSIDIQQRLAEALERGDAPVVGEERADLAQVGDRVVVVRCRVVDRLQLTGKVQLVLTEKGITEIIGEPPSVEAELLGDGDSRQLAAFYVEAPESDFTSAVDTLTTLDGVTEVTTNFVATTTESSLEGMSINGIQGGESAIRPGRIAQEGLRSLAFDAPASAEAADSRSSPAPASAQPASPAPQVADESALTDRSDSLGVNVAEAAPADRRQFAAAPAKGYQVAVPARKELLEELQGKEGESEGRADGLTKDSKLASARQSSNQPVQQWNYFYGQTNVGPTAPPPSDRVRAVIVVLPETDE